MMLKIDSLVHAYPGGNRALDGVSLEVRAGERVAIVGANGAGKSTLARHLIGIERPTSGTVEVDGQPTEGRSIAELARSVGFVFQNPQDELHARTVAKAVEFGPRNLGVPAERRAAAVSWALSVTGLTEHADAHPHHLSFGQRKRVALASVLAMETPMVVLDEPTTGQDHRSLRLLEAVIDELGAQGRTVLAITHDMEFCARHFHRVVVLDRGRIRWDGRIEDWLALEASADAPSDGHRALDRPQITRLAQELGWAAVASVDAFLDELERRTATSG